MKNWAIMNTGNNNNIGGGVIGGLGGLKDISGGGVGKRYNDNSINSTKISNNNNNYNNNITITTTTTNINNNKN